MRHSKEFFVDSGRWGVTSEVAALIVFLIGLWEHGNDRPLSGFIFVCISVPLFWIGAYIAWNKKRTELEAEKKRNRTPNFQGEIANAFICAEPENLEGAHVSFVMLQVAAWNQIDMNPVSVHKYLLSLDVNGRSYRGEFRWDAIDSRVHSFILKGHTDNAAQFSLHMGGTFGDLCYLSQRSGNLIFRVPGLQKRTDLHADLKLTLIDVADNNHTIGRINCPLNSDRFWPVAN